MNDKQTKQLKEIEALLAERRTFEQWLDQLESHRDATPAHVYLKIRADYQARFDGAQERLGAETDAVHALVQGMESSLSAQDAAIAAKGDERAEAGIRAAVGEFTAKEWDKRKAVLESAIAALESERASMQREMETLQALLSEAAPTSSDDAIVPAAPSATLSATVEREPPPPLAREPEPYEPSPVESPTPAVDEVAFLRSVLGRSTPHRTPLAVQSVEPEAEVSSVSADPVSDPARAKSVRRDTPLSMPADQARESGTFPRASTSFGSPTPKTSEAQKSLTCSACRALNFPTEWYCEKCGGELAAF